MQIIQFIDTCEVVVEGGYGWMDGVWAVPKTFMPGDEEAVDSLIDSKDGTFAVVFMDETKASIPDDVFIVVEAKDDSDVF